MCRLPSCPIRALQTMGAAHAAAQLALQHSTLPEGRGNGLAAWRQ